MNRPSTVVIVPLRKVQTIPSNGRIPSTTESRSIMGCTLPPWVRIAVRDSFDDAYLSPLRGLKCFCSLPRACARGSNLAPLRGWFHGSLLLPRADYLSVVRHAFQKIGGP